MGETLQEIRGAQIRYAWDQVVVLGAGRVVVDGGE